MANKKRSPVPSSPNHDDPPFCGDESQALDTKLGIDDGGSKRAFHESPVAERFCDVFLTASVNYTSSMHVTLKSFISGSDNPPHPPLY